MKSWLEWLMVILACIGLSIVATSCATVRQPPCVSKCGMLMEMKGNGAMSCSVIDEAESTMIRETDKEFCKKDARLCKKPMCEALFGWQIKADEDVLIYRNVRGQGLEPVVGLSSMGSKEMWLGAHMDWRHGAYPHEFFHVVFNGDSGWKDEGESAEHGDGHQGWKSHGIYEFIDDFRAGRR